MEKSITFSSIEEVEKELLPNFYLKQVMDDVKREPLKCGKELANLILKSVRT